jgi:hypothetical protein
VVVEVGEVEVVVVDVGLLLVVEVGAVCVVVVLVGLEVGEV